MNEQPVPTGMPRLDSGRHFEPELGGCLMELVSVLPPVFPWSDHPRCTHPALAEVARLVTDGTYGAGPGRAAGLRRDLTGAGDAGRPGRAGPGGTAASACGRPRSVRAAGPGDSPPPDGRDRQRWSGRLPGTG